MPFRFDEDQLAIRGAVRATCADRFDLTDVAEGSVVWPTGGGQMQAGLGVFVMCTEVMSEVLEGARSCSPPPRPG